MNRLRRVVLFAIIFSLTAPLNAFAVTDQTTTNRYRALNNIPFTGGSKTVCGSSSAITAIPGAVTGTVSSFVDAYGQQAFDIGKQYGIPYDAILGQAALESGWGKSGLTLQAFNFFGMKVGTSWTGDTITMSTAEQDPSGKVTYVDAAFRKYANAAESFKDYASLIRNNTRYAAALQYPNNPIAYITAVAKGGYATDVNYANKVATAIVTIQKYIASKNLFPPSSSVIPDAAPPTTSSTSVQSSGCLPSTFAGSALSASVVSVAKAELAKSPVEYDANVLKHTTGRREAWCADFVSWVYNQAGSPFTGGGAGGWQIPGVLSMKAWFESGKNGSRYFKVGVEAPQPGDVAFYIGTDTPDGGSSQHVALVISVDTASNTMVTIGGNESNAVRMSTRQIKLGASSLSGFGRR